MKFHIVGGGDMSVGIAPSDEVVEFTGNSTWDEDLIQTTKDLLKEWDDNGATVYTEKEYDEMLKQEETYAYEMLYGEE